MPEAVLAINAGSSSLKFGLYEIDAAGALQLASRGLLDLGDVARLTAKAADGTLLIDDRLAGNASPEARFSDLLDWIEKQSGASTLAGVGHRIVHGGSEFSQPTLLTPAMVESIDRLTPLAPLHQPRSLMPIRVLAKLRPDLPQVGCFDTAFHRTMDVAVSRIALPRRYEAEGVRRYGFHGLSYDYIAGRLQALSLAEKRTVVAHLGNGASLCAMRHGRSVDTTMGFSALDGLVMGTRGGSIDPGVLLYLLMQKQLAPAELQQLLYHRSGLLGVSGISSDVRTLLASDDRHAREALDLFAFRASREVAAMANTLGGLECLVFTAGVGEHAAPIRAAICERLAWLGVRLDLAANDRDAELISSRDSGVEVRVIPTDEESVVARGTLATVR